MDRFSWVTSLICFCTCLGLAESKREQDSLRGLTGIYVMVEHLEPNAEEADLTDSQLQTALEQGLNQAGICILSDAEWLRHPGMPFLYLDVTWMKGTKAEMYAVSNTLQLQQRIKLERNPSITLRGVPTWHTNKVVLVNKGRFPALIVEIASELVGRFATDYQVVNPK